MCPQTMRGSFGSRRGSSATCRFNRPVTQSSRCVQLQPLGWSLASGRPNPASSPPSGPWAPSRSPSVYPRTPERDYRLISRRKVSRVFPVSSFRAVCSFQPSSRLLEIADLSSGSPAQSTVNSSNSSAPSMGARVCSLVSVGGSPRRGGVIGVVKVTARCPLDERGRHLR